MKKILLLTFAVLWIAAIYAQTTIYKTVKTPVIDGVITSNDPWTNNWIELTKSFTGNSTSAMSAKFQITFDDNSLYIVARIKDSSPGYLSSFTYENDGFEIFIALDTTSGTSGAYKTGDYQLRKQRGKDLSLATDVTIGGSGLSVTALKFNPNFKVAEVDSGNVYVQEWQIPLHDMAINMNPAWDKKQFKFDVQAIDNTTNATGGRTQQIFWNSNTNSQWNNTKYLGLITLDIPVTDNRQAQSITFNNIPILKIGDNDLSLLASATSGLPVVFTSSNTNVATIVNGKIHVVGVGTSNITAYQFGNNTYKCAVPLTKTLIVKGMIISPVSKTPVIDGIINSDDPWTNEWIPLASAQTVNTTTSMNAKFQINYDADNLYIVSRIEDNSIGNSSANSWENDCLEVYLAMDTTTWSKGGVYKTGDYQMRKLRTVALPQGLEGIIGESSMNNNYYEWQLNNPTAQIIENDNGTVYIQEWRLPWTALKNNVSPAWDYKQFKMDLKATDNTTDATGGHTQRMFWYSNTEEQWRNTNYEEVVFLRNPIENQKFNQTIVFKALETKKFGDSDIQPELSVNSPLSITLTSTNTSVASIVDGKIHITGAGNADIIASQPGNTSYNAATIVTQTFTVEKADQVITFNSLPIVSMHDQEFSPGATINSNLEIEYTSSDPHVAIIVSGKIHITGQGSAIITAAQPGNNNYNAAVSVQQTLTVTNKTSQQITFNTIPDKTYGDADFDLSATASSGLNVYYTISNTEIATIVNGKVHILKPGSTEIIASQSGDANYNAALDVKRTLNISKANQTITFASLPTKTFGDSDFDLSASSSSGLAITYSSSNTSIATIASNKIHIIKAGSVQITASQAGNDNYNSATDIMQILVVNKANQSISFDSINIKSVNDADFKPVVSSNSQLSVVLTSSNTSVATIVNGNIHITGIGTSIITASQAGDINYNAAANIKRVLMITSKNSQSITFGALAEAKYGSADIELTASASSGLAVSFTSSNSGIATIVNGKIQILKSGKVNIIASQPGNDTYNPASEVTQQLVIIKADPVINWTKPNDITYGTLLTATQLNASCTLTGTYTYTPASGSKLNAGDAQNLKVDFTPSDTNYNKASKTLIINVKKAEPLLTWTAPADINYGTPLGNAQLNATCNITGTFTYNPAGGTTLASGTHDLSVIFMPEDVNNYDSAKTVVQIKILPPLKIINTEEKELTSVYPNPFNESIRVISKSSLDNITIIDLNGKTVFESNNKNQKEININTCELKQGMYLLIINKSITKIIEKRK